MYKGDIVCKILTSAASKANSFVNLYGQQREHLNSATNNRFK